MELVVGSIAIVVYVAFFAILGLCYAVVVADYIMSSIALQRIAKRRGIDKPWFVWLPVVRDWLLGELLDADDATRGVHRNWKKIFLILSAICSGIMAIAYICFVGMYVVMFASAAAETEEMMVLAVVPILLYYVLILVAAVVAGALNACRMISIFKIFEATVPEKVVKYFLIYLMVPVAGSICLLKCKELGCLEPEQVEYEEEI